MSLLLALQNAQTTDTIGIANLSASGGSASSGAVASFTTTGLLFGADSINTTSSKASINSVGSALSTTALANSVSAITIVGIGAALGNAATASGAAAMSSATAQGSLSGTSGIAEAILGISSTSSAYTIANDSIVSGTAKPILTSTSLLSGTESSIASNTDTTITSSNTSSADEASIISTASTLMLGTGSLSNTSAIIEAFSGIGTNSIADITSDVSIISSVTSTLLATQGIVYGAEPILEFSNANTLITSTESSIASGGIAEGVIVSIYITELTAVMAATADGASVSSELLLSSSGIGFVPGNNASVFGIIGNGSYQPPDDIVTFRRKTTDRNFFQSFIILTPNFPQNPQGIIGFRTRQRMIFNCRSGTINYSFDGVTVHGTMTSDVPLNLYEFGLRSSKYIWLSGNGIIDIYAWQS